MVYLKQDKKLNDFIKTKNNYFNLEFEGNLNKLAKAFRKYLGQQLRIKFTPQLKFYYDDTMTYTEKLDTIFHNIDNKE